MTTVDFITELFCRVAEQLVQADKEHKHSQGKLYASEIVTLALLDALKGSGQRAFWRWLVRDYRPLFPHLPVPGCPLGAPVSFVQYASTLDRYLSGCTVTSWRHRQLRHRVAPSPTRRAE